MGESLICYQYHYAHNAEEMQPLNSGSKRLRISRNIFHFLYNIDVVVIGV